MKLLGKICGYGIVVALLIAAGYMIFDQWNSTQTMKAKLAAAEKQLSDLAIDHRDTMDALNKAQKSREEIYERAREQEKRLHEVLAKHPLAKQLVPDDLRMCLKWAEDGSCEVSASRDAAGGNPDTGQGENQDRGRHGADNR